MSKQLKLGLFGFGVVGHGLYDVLHETHELNTKIKRICVKDHNKKRSLPTSYFTYEPNDIILDPEIDAVVEMITDADVAFDLLKRSLENGKAYITANKKMLAEHQEEVYALQQKYRLPVLYECAVCANIPIIRNLEEYYNNDLVQRLEGIFNGSTNYILTKVFEENMGYPEALRLAQKLGFAEADPSLDVKGFDAKYKLAIVLTHAFGVFVKPEDVINIGIDKISDQDFKYAQDNGCTIKLIARAYKNGNNVFAYVAPQFVPVAHPLATIRNEYNGVLIEEAFSEKQLFVGKGAGSYPTGSALLADIFALTYGYRYAYRKFSQDEKVRFSNSCDVPARVCVAEGASIPVDPANLRVDQVDGKKIYTGQISLKKLAEWNENSKVSIILYEPKSEAASEKDLQHDRKTA